MLLAPLMPYIDPSNPPTIFGVSGYSGAGTKTGENDEHGRPKTVPKIVSNRTSRPTMTILKSVFLFAECSRFERRNPSVRVDRSHSRARSFLPTLSALQPTPQFAIPARLRAQRCTVVLRNHLCPFCSIEAVDASRRDLETLRGKVRE